MLNCGPTKRVVTWLLMTEAKSEQSRTLHLVSLELKKRAGTKDGFDPSSEALQYPGREAWIRKPTVA